MTIGDLRRKLERLIDRLDDYDDETKVKVVSNTYFLEECDYFLGISGYDGGYVNLENPADEDGYDGVDKQYKKCSKQEKEDISDIIGADHILSISEICSWYEDPNVDDGVRDKVYAILDNYPLD